MSDQTPEHIPPMRAAIVLISEGMPPKVLSEDLLEVRSTLVGDLPPELQEQIGGDPNESVLGFNSLSIRQLLVDALRLVDEGIANDPNAEEAHS